MKHFILTIFIIFNILHISPFILLAEKSLELNPEEKQQRRERLKKFTKDTFVNRSNERADEETKKADSKLQLLKEIQDKIQVAEDSLQELQDKVASDGNNSSSELQKILNDMKLYKESLKKECEKNEQKRK